MSAVLTAVIVGCNYLYFSHRWSLVAIASKQSSAMLTSLKAQDSTASHFICLYSK